MNESELANESREAQPQAQADPGKPLFVDWAESEWFNVWLKIARHEPIKAAA
jgi:hypothetical protein